LSHPFVNARRDSVSLSLLHLDEPAAEVGELSFGIEAGAKHPAPYPGRCQKQRCRNREKDDLERRHCDKLWILVGLAHRGRAWEPTLFQRSAIGH
jgi:hypothetical protein